MMTELPAVELHTGLSHGSGNGTKRFYKVEVRTTYSSPTVLGDFVIDHCWRTLPIYEGRSQWGVNIPVQSWDRDGLDHGLVPYSVAEAHRWAFIACLEAKSVGGSLCIKTRLVEIEYHYSFSTKEVGVSAQSDGRMGRLVVSPRHAAVEHDDESEAT